MVTKKGRIKLRQKGSSGGSADGLEVEILSAENSGEGEVLDLAEVATDDNLSIGEDFLEELSSDEVDDSDEDRAEDKDADKYAGKNDVKGKKTSSSSTLSRYDPLRAYLSEISQHPRLSKEDERAIAIRYLKDGDLKAAYQLTVSNLWLVVAIARKYQRAARSLLDLIQEGNIGLMDAVKNFDPYRDVRFPSYASWWIKAYIIRFVIANWRLVKIGTTQAQRKLFFNLEKERENLERQGFVPTAKLLASNLNVKESEVIEMQQRLGGSDMSVDAPLSTDGEAINLHTILPSDEPTAEEALAALQIKETISAAMKSFAETLNKKERAIFEKRLLSEDKATLQEIADEFSLSKERIRQLENRIKDKLKEFLKENLGESFLSTDLGIK